MSNEHVTVIDFVARGDSPDEWKMVLVEEGPWASPIESRLRRIQERLYECIDITIEGKLAEKFPESNGKNITIQLDCYDAPEDDVTTFFDRFANGVFTIGEQKEALNKSTFVKSISFKVNFQKID